MQQVRILTGFLLMLLITGGIAAGCDDDEKRQSDDRDDTDSATDGDADTDSDSDSDSDSDGDSDTDSDTDTDTGPEPLDYARNIVVQEIEFNQGVAVQIAADGAPIAPTGRDTLLVKNRGGLFRALWATESGWTDRRITAHLTLSYADATEIVLTDTRDISGPPDPDTIDGTFRWILTPDQVKAGMQYSVALYEMTSEGALIPETLPRIPQIGTADLGVPPADMFLDITFVPVTVNGVTPLMNETNVQALIDGFHNMNPVSQVRAVLHTPVEGAASIDSILADIEALRAAESAPPQMYYIGMPPVSELGWTGLSYVAGPEEFGIRVSASPISNTPGNYPDDLSWGFTIHETGHAQGRFHTPGCGADEPDEDWPYGTDNTKINVQGYDLANNLLRAGDYYEDYMNYCEPDWPSDFTYNGTAERIDLLSSWARRLPAPPAQWILKGILPISRPAIWSALEGHMDPSAPFAAPVTGTAIVKADGSTVSLIGQMVPLGDNQTRAISLLLPDAPETFQKVSVELDGKNLDVPLDGIADKYRRFVKHYRN